MIHISVDNTEALYDAVKLSGTNERVVHTACKTAMKWQEMGARVRYRFVKSEFNIADFPSRVTGPECKIYHRLLEVTEADIADAVVPRDVLGQLATHQVKVTQNPRPRHVCVNRYNKSPKTYRRKRDVPVKPSSERSPLPNQEKHLDAEESQADSRRKRRFPNPFELRTTVVDETGVGLSSNHIGEEDVIHPHAP